MERFVYESAFGVFGARAMPGAGVAGDGRSRGEGVDGEEIGRGGGVKKWLEGYVIRDLEEGFFLLRIVHIRYHIR